MRNIIKKATGPLAGLPGPVGAVWETDTGPITEISSSVTGARFEDLGRVCGRDDDGRMVVLTAIRDVGGGNLRFVTAEQYRELIGGDDLRVVLDW